MTYGFEQRREWARFLEWRLRDFYGGQTRTITGYNAELLAVMDRRGDASPSLSTASHGPRELRARLTDEEISERWPDKSGGD
jgi:hypothetical protein